MVHTNVTNGMYATSLQQCGDESAICSEAVHSANSEPVRSAECRVQVKRQCKHLEMCKLTV